MTRFSMSGLFALTEWIARFAYINILWIVFSLAGLVIFGFFPSTIAMFTVIRKWIIGETDIHVFETFWTAYKSEFWKGNGLGLIILFITGLVFFDLVFLKNSGLSPVFHLPFYLFIFAAALTVLYLLPVYVHYHTGFLQLFKNAFFITLISPLANIVILIGLASAFLIMKTLPGLLFFYGGSAMAAIIMSGCYTAFQRIENKKRLPD